MFVFVLAQGMACTSASPNNSSSAAGAPGVGAAAGMTGMAGAATSAAGAAGAAGTVTSSAGAGGAAGAGGPGQAGANTAGSGGAGGALVTTPPPPDPVITLKDGTLRLEVWGETTIRVLYGTTAPMPAKSLAVNETRPVTQFTLLDTATDVTITTSKLRAHADKTTGQVTFLDPTGSVILAEAASASHQLTAVKSGPGPYVSVGTFTPKAGELFYGLGQHQQTQGGKMAYSGSIQLLQKNPGESSVPLLISSGGYGILWDNPSVTTFDLSANVKVTSEVANLVDYYFMVGGADQVVGAYRALTGQAPLFGKWALGYWQSKDHYGSQAELLGVASTYRSKQIPIDNIVQDWTYWGNNPQGSHLFDASYPDPAGMFSTLHQTGFHAMISVWGKFYPNSANFDALKAAGNFLTPALGDGSYYYDAFKADARTMYWQQMNTALFSKGVDAWWLDATEPELNTNWGEFRTFKTDAGLGAVVFNGYPLLTTTAVHDGQRAVSSDKRVFILTRSAYSGDQRNGAATWSGDITGDWATFKRQIPAGLNFSLSGIPYWTTDIGGYFLSDLGGAGSPNYTELFERWFQFGAFCPIFRTHGTGPDRNLYAFGDAAQTVLTGVDQLRYRLMPYIYSSAWQVTHEGYTMMRALLFDFPADPQALNVPDQFMFGQALLVNPVSDAGATSRSVYLPANTTWYDFWAGSSAQGGQTVSAPAPIDHLPLYVRGGSIVPLGPLVQYASEKPADPIELRVYRGADGAFTLYEDENDNYNYEKGIYATIPLTWSEAKKTLTIGARAGTFPGMLPSRTFNVVFVAAGHGTGLAVTGAADKTVTYTGAALDVVAP
jgi:alpha-D-xyloside xylohydrolase